MKIYLCVDTPRYDGEHNEETIATFTSKRNANRFSKETGTEVREMELDLFSKEMSAKKQLFEVIISKDDIISTRKVKNSYFVIRNAGVAKFSAYNTACFEYLCFASNEKDAQLKAEAERDLILKENRWPKAKRGGRRLVGDMPLRCDLLSMGAMNMSQMMEDSDIHGSEFSSREPKLTFNLKPKDDTDETVN